MNQMSEIQKAYEDKTLEEAKDFYHKIKSIYDRTGHSRSCQLGLTWMSGGQNMRDMLNIINSDASAIESIRLTDNTVMFSVNPSGPIKEKMVDWYIAYLMRSGHSIFNLDITIQESPISANSVRRGDRLLTPDFLRTVILSLQIQEYCSIPKSKFRIVELGGGCGHLARTLKLFIPNSVYVDIDIPETLYFAYIFLKLNFPHAKTCYVTDPSQLRDGVQEFDFVFIPTMFAECILQDEFDLFCNTASLGEMTNPVIRYWMDFVQNRLKVKYFFGLNRFLNTIIDLPVGFKHWRLNENECSVLFDANWRILHWELEPPFSRCPYEEPSIVTRNLEIMAERLPDTSVNETNNQLLSQQIVEDLMDEDWIRYRDKYVHVTMRSNVLANDLTMSGTLFKLWESIRLYPNKTNVAMMLIYLHTLTKRSYPFEEWLYYRNLLRSLVSGDKTLHRRTMLAEEKYKNLWKHALALSISYELFSIWVWRYYIFGLFPPFMRPALIRLNMTGEKLYRALRSRLSFIP